MSSQEKARLLMDIDPRLKADLKSLARADDRTMTGYICRVLRLHVEEENAKLMGHATYKPPGLQ